MGPKVLFISQPHGFKVDESTYCGVGISGNILGTILTKSDRYDIQLLYTNSTVELENAILSINPVACIYNYHDATCGWLIDPGIRNKYTNVQHIIIHYDFTQEKINTFHPDQYHGFKYIISDDSSLKGNDNVFITRRFLPGSATVQYIENDIPRIGFQGFGFRHKGIHRIAEQVQKEFDQAIIRLHMPKSYYCDPYGHQSQQRLSEVNQIITKPGIKVEVSFNFMETQDIVNWLAQNTINCYFYDYLDGAGIASAPNFALASHRPIAVTKSHQLRNFWNLTPSVCIEDRSLKDIISSGIEPLKSLYEEYTIENVLSDYHRILDRLCVN